MNIVFANLNGIQETQITHAEKKNNWFVVIPRMDCNLMITTGQVNTI